MDVTKDNLDVACDEFERIVTEAAKPGAGSFVALDLEMTGIHGGPDTKEALSDTPSMRYRKMRSVASRFNIIQVGLSLYTPRTRTSTSTASSSSSGGEAAAADEYTCHTYNVYVFPARGEVVLEGTAVEFLVKNGMSFDTWFRSGVPYLRAKEGEELRGKMFPEEKQQAAAAAAAAAGAEKKGSTEEDGDGDDVAMAESAPKPKQAATAASTPTKPPMTLDRPDDVKFCDDALAGVAAWWAATTTGDDDEGDDKGGDGAATASDGKDGTAAVVDATTNGDAAADGDDTDGRAPKKKKSSAEHFLPMCNSYLRRYLFQQLERLYPADTHPSFVVESRVPDPARHWQKIMVASRLDSSARLAREKAEAEEKEMKYKSKLGFRRMWNALVGSGLPLVVHNGLFDLLFVVQHFHGPLPETLGEFKGVIGGLFKGGVYDTRHVGGTVMVGEGGSGNANAIDDDDEKKEEDAATPPKKNPLFPELRLDRVYAVAKSASDTAAAIASSASESEAAGQVASEVAPHIAVRFADGHDRYEDASKAILHEAGYDSYITAFAFAYMRRVLEVQQGRHHHRGGGGKTGAGGASSPQDGGSSLAAFEHLADSQYRLPLYRSFYPGVNLTPGSRDVIASNEGEAQYVLSGFPREYQTSDVMRLFDTTTAAATNAANATTGGNENGDGTSSGGGNGNNGEEKAEEDDARPKVTVRWIDDKSVCVRFADADAAAALANVEAHGKVLATRDGDDDSSAMVVMTLESYLRAADDDEAAGIDEADAKGEGGGTKRRAAKEDGGATSEEAATSSSKKAKTEK